MTDRLDPPAEGSASHYYVEMHAEAHDSSAVTQIGVQINLPQPSPPPDVRDSLPPDTAAFTGREPELHAIIAAVAQAKTTADVVAIHAIDGMPGVGKTALAVHIAHQLRPRFPDRQLFVDLHAHTPGQTAARPDAALAGLLAAVGVEARSLPTDLDGRVSLWRDRMAGQRTLLILDNAADSSQVTPLLPGGTGCLVLITSRRHLGDLPTAVVSVLLDTLPPEQAALMFKRLAPDAVGESAAVEELVEAAGYLPLAISILARFRARHPAWSLRELIDETRTRLLAVTAESATVGAAFDLSYQYLQPGLQAYFTLLGLHPGNSIDRHAAAALTDMPLRQTAVHLDALHGEGLLGEVGYRRYGMHDIIRVYAGSQAAAITADDRDRALGRLLNYYQHAAELAGAQLAGSYVRPRGLTAVGEAALTAVEVPDVSDYERALIWSRAERTNLLACLRYATETGQRARVVAFTSALAPLLNLDGPWDDALILYRNAVDSARSLGDQSGLADALNYLGHVQQLTGNFLGAISTLQEALGLYQALGDRLGQAIVLGDLGIARGQTGDFSAAAEALEQVLGLFRELGDRLNEAKALGNLGIVRARTGDFPGAAEALEQVLGLFREIGDPLGEANALGNLGKVQMQAGNLNAAGLALNEALTLFTVLGVKVGEVEALVDIGALHLVRSELGQAETKYRQALELSREIDGAFDEAQALAGLGRCFLKAARPADARIYLHQALEIFNRLGAAEAAAVAAELADSQL